MTKDYLNKQYFTQQEVLDLMRFIILGGSRRDFNMDWEQECRILERNQPFVNEAFKYGQEKLKSSNNELKEYCKKVLD